MSDAGGVGGAGGGGVGGSGGVGGGNDAASGSNNDSGTTGDSLGGGPNSAEASVGLGPDDSATASAPTDADSAAANAALGSVATDAPSSVSPDTAPTSLGGMISQALDGFSSVVDGFATAMDKMGGFAPPGVSNAIGFAQDAIGLAKSVMDGFQTGDWSGLRDGVTDIASGFFDKFDAAKDALAAIQEGDWGTALEAAARISKSADALLDVVNVLQSARTSMDTGNWSGTAQLAARAF